MGGAVQNNTVLLAMLCDARGAQRSAQQLAPDLAPLLKTALEKGSGALAIAFGEFLASYAAPATAVAAALEFQRALEDASQRYRPLVGVGARVLVDQWPETGADDVALDGMRRTLESLQGNGVLVAAAAFRQLDPITRSGCRELREGLHEVELSHHRVTYREATRPLRSQAAGNHDLLTFTRGGRDTVLKPQQCPFTIGRDAGCSLVLRGPNVSRLHASVVHEQGYFLFQDESRNGTYLIIGGDEIFVHRSNFPMTDSGIISPGVPLSEQTGEVLRYRCGATNAPPANPLSFSLRRPNR